MKKLAALLAFFPFIALAQPRMTPETEKQYREVYRGWIGADGVPHVLI